MEFCYFRCKIVSLMVKCEGDHGVEVLGKLW
jgi:hypothetical protein